MFQKTWIFNLILLGIPSSLVLSIKNRGWGRGGLLNGQNLLSVTKVFFDDPLRKGLLRHYLKSKANKNFKVLPGQITSTMNSLFLFFVCVFFSNSILTLP